MSNTRLRRMLLAKDGSYLFESNDIAGKNTSRVHEFVRADLVFFLSSNIYFIFRILSSQTFSPSA